MARAVRPEVPAGTIKQDNSALPSSLRPVTAWTVMPLVSGLALLVIQIFEPLITHSLVALSKTAVVLDACASLPASGSVRPKAQRPSPVQRLGRYFFFCSSEP